MRHLIMFITLAAGAVAMSGCAMSWNIEGHGRPVTTEDGAEIAVFELWPEGKQDVRPRGYVVHIHGDRPAGVRDLIPRLAGAAEMGFRPILVEHRGVDLEGNIAPDAPDVDPKQRLADVRAAVRSVIGDDLDGRPLLVVGAHEGAPIALRLAQRDDRVSHVMVFTPRDPGPVTIGLAAVDRPTFLALAGADGGLSAKDESMLRAAAAGNDHVTLAELPGLDADLVEVSTGRDGFPRLELEVLAFMRAHGLMDDAEHAAWVARVKRAHPELF